ncbi:MAG: hypothetical protein OEV64_06600 [Desulfobulbaceae bacterium]|nr:hypothetical protein [Desulfobulbaceae bacterium]
MGPGSDPVVFLEKIGCRVFHGRHSFYLSRRADIEKICPALLDFYPYPFGLKIVKSGEISPDGSPYYTSRLLAPASSHMSMRAVGSMLEKVSISNLLHEYGVAPRVYDLVRLESSAGSYHAFIVQHVGGDFVTGEEGVKFIRRFLRVFQRLELEIISIDEHCDLRPPDFRHNIVADLSGSYYVDIQNFVLYTSGYGTKIQKRLRQLMMNDGPVSGGGRDLSLRRVEGFLQSCGVSIQKARILDLWGDDGTMARQLLTMGVGRVSMIRPVKLASLIRQTLYLCGFSRFEVISPASRLKDDFDLVICRSRDLKSVLSRCNRMETLILLLDTGGESKINNIEVSEEGERLELLGEVELIVGKEIVPARLVKGRGQ